MSFRRNTLTAPTRRKNRKIAAAVLKSKAMQVLWITITLYGTPIAMRSDSAAPTRIALDVAKLSALVADLALMYST